MDASAPGHLITSCFFHMTRCFADANNRSFNNNQRNINAIIFAMVIKKLIKKNGHVYRIKFTEGLKMHKKHRLNVSFLGTAQKTNALADLLLRRCFASTETTRALQ